MIEELNESQLKMIFRLAGTICILKASDVPHVCFENYAPKILYGLIVAFKLGMSIDPIDTPTDIIQAQVEKLVFQ